MSTSCSGELKTALILFSAELDVPSWVFPSCFEYYDNASDKCLTCDIENCDIYICVFLQQV